MNKKLLFFIIGIIAIFVALRMLKHTSSPAVEAPTNTAVALSESRPYCFAYTHEATTDAPYKIEEHMKLTRVRDSITGTKDGTQSGPDMTNGYTGALSGGPTADGTIELVYAYKIEGSEGRELEVFKIDGENLLKQRYVLDEKEVDGNSILIPDRTGTPTSLLYKSEACT